MKAARFTALFLLSLTLGLAASSGLRAQDPRGSEIRINRTTAGTQWLPDVATAADGRFVVVWSEDLGTSADTVMARLFDATGRPRSTEIRIARVTRKASGSPAVSMASDGRFVVVWGGGTEDPDVVFGRRFSADGRPLGPRFRLARSTERSQHWPDVAMAPDGSFVAAWTQDDGGSSAEVPHTTDVFLRRFGADGRPLGPAVLAIGGYEEQSVPKVAVKANGDFVVVCQSYGADGAFYGIVARHFSRSGVPTGEPFVVNDDPQQVSQYEPALAVAPDGSFAIAWTDRGADYGRDPSLEVQDYTGVVVQFFSPSRPELRVNTFLPGIQDGPAVSALQTGGFLVLWQSGAGQDGDGYGIFARVYAPNGKPLGREFRINLNRSGFQYQPAVAIAPNGKGVAVWIGPDGDGTGVFARRIAPPDRKP